MTSTKSRALGPMTWIIHPARHLLDQHHEAWQTLNARCYGAHPLLDARFVGPLYEYFGSEGTWLMERKDHADNVVGLALVEKAGMGFWHLFMPSQANIGPLLLDDGGSPVRACGYLDDFVQSLPGLTLQLGLQKQDPRYSRLAEIEHEPRLERIPDWSTTHVDTDGDFERYWQARPKKVRRGVRRILKRLDAENIRWRLVEVRDRHGMAAGVRDYGELESAGWKGDEHTAISRDNVQGRFYTRVLEDFAQTRNSTIYQLYFNDRLAASLLTVGQNDMLIVLKTTYNEAVARLAPGRLIDYLMLERAFADPRIRRIENYTNASAEDARWCSGSRVLYHVNFYRSQTLRRMAGVRRRIARLSTRRCVSACMAVTQFAVIRTITDWQDYLIMVCSNEL